MLSSPIILYDYPQVASESAGDLFDSTEIDELLMLRIQTMTDAEKLEMRRVDDQARKILERAESLLPEHLLKMRGTVREVRRSKEEFFNPTSIASARRLGRMRTRSCSKTIPVGRSA